MRINHEITNSGKLLDEKGNIKEPGFSKKLISIYDRNDIKAKRWRIKEWDYYYIGNQHYGICLTISDAGFIGVASASVMEYDIPSAKEGTVTSLFPLGKINLPPTLEKGDLSFSKGKANLSFLNNGTERKIQGFFPKIGKAKEPLEIDITLSNQPEEYMVIATPFNKEAHFYYNAKVNNMIAKGYFKLGEKVYNLDNALGTLDWGRGVWTYNNTWYWGSLSATLDTGDLFGFNIGYGFGNTEQASENMIFFNGKAHKLDDVKFNIPGDDTGNPDFMKPWTFTSSDGRLEMDFMPVYDRCPPLNIGILCMIPHQVFGRFSGRAMLDNGEEIIFKDLLGFAEKVHNKW